ncbi:MAG: peptidylprolyl isomerase [Ginsengibacter sp.]
MKHLLYLLAFIFFISCTATKSNRVKANEPVRVQIETDSGTMVARLYNQTPLHRNNFIKLVKEHFYDSLLFHRVIKNFMIQGGDPGSKNAKPGALLGEGGLKYTLPAEFDTLFFHKKGALAAARENDEENPKKESSGTQFYIVEGKTFTDDEMDKIETRFKIKIPENHRVVYRSLGGAPFLDMSYTVFGEVESGLEVIDKIANAPKDANNRPLQDIRMKITILKRNHFKK